MFKKGQQYQRMPAPNTAAGLLLLPILLLTFSSGHADPLFADDSVVEITLTGPLQSLIDAGDEGNYWPFMMQADGREHQVRIRTRGNSRFKLCQFPLLRLDFRNVDMSGTVFAEQDTLKLVTHCRKHASSEVDLLQEYAAYRIFEVLSDIGYRTRLLRVTYSDSDGRFKGGKVSRYAFAIEPPRKLESRVNGERLRVGGVALSTLNERQAALVYVFHYMIGNADWSLVTAEGDTSCCHNGHLYRLDGETCLVPYDFDLSGLVNARYAKPHPAVGISRVTQRRYRGYCISRNFLEYALATIKARQSEIFAVIDGLPGLSEKEISKTRKYLQGFFDRARNEEKLLKSFEARCL